MKNKINFLLLILLLLTLIFPATASAQQKSDLIKIGENITVPIDKSYETIVSIGGDVKLDGNVETTIVTVGGNAEINGSVGESVVVVGGNALINESVKEAVIIVGGNALINKDILGDLVVIGNKAEIAPNIKILGDVILVGGELAKDDSSNIQGDLVEISAKNFVTNYNFFGIPLLTIFITFKIISSAVMALLILLAGLLFSNSLQQSKKYTLDSPGKTFLFGLLFAFFFIPISFLLIITIIGIPLLLLFWFIYGVMVIWGSAVLADIIGSKLLKSLKYQGSSTALSLIIGIVLYLLIAQIPFIGITTVIIIKIMALGTSAVSHLGFRKQ